MKNQVLEVVEATGEKMAAIGYFPGVLAVRWAEIAIEQAQDTAAMGIFWSMRINLLGMLDN
jgi:hypothetical protein